MSYFDEEQVQFKYQSEKQPDEQDDFATNVKPLEELLDSVRHIEGFPLGKDEDILALSDPPYYTACPNPYINDFIKKFGKSYDPETDDYHRTPYVGDVSEGKNDPIYNAHSYHTKVPHKAIMKYIEHYTDEGDIVFDGFCGSGMTGVAAQLLNRRAILADLSPAATFIAYNYNTPVDVDEFEREAKRILREVEEECGWMYETLHTDGKTKGRINYTIWSDVYICPYCENEYVFWEAAVDNEAGEVKKQYSCPDCKASITKNDCLRAKTICFDNAIGQEVTQAKQYLVLIKYKVGNKSYEKQPDKFDHDLINKINESSIPHWFPTNRMPEGYNTEQPKRSHGATHAHHFYTKRNLWVLALLRKYGASFIFSSMIARSSKLVMTVMSNYFAQLKGETKGGWAGKPLMGTLYLPSIFTEVSPIEQLKTRIKSGLRLSHFKEHYRQKPLISTNSLTDNNNMFTKAIDYIFTDPPFGENLMYSELNFLWESWLKVFTSNHSEAIVNKSQNKKLTEYKDLMTECFREMYRILKPNRWMTVVFHNSKASVWNAIQDSITKAGFIIAQVTVMDKKQGSFKQVTYAGAVKNDLVINAYKPKQDFSERFLKNAGTDMEKEFISEHLDKLPIEPNIERTEQMLYSKMLAHYVQRAFI